MTMPPAAPSTHGTPQRRRFWLFVPLVVFIALAAVFWFALQSGDPSKIPSVLIGKPVPVTEFPALKGLRKDGNPVFGFSSADLKNGTVSVINFWASWCGPCIEEHPYLITMREKTGVALFGVNYKDEPTNARRFLGRYGNPYGAVGTDQNGRGAIEWGVYGMPETFVINGAGEIVYKHVGPISASSLTTKLLPAIKAARAPSK